MNRYIPKCTVCGGKAPTFLSHIQYSYNLRLDTLCNDCFKWMDDFMISYDAREYDPYRKGNPFIIYYYDKSPLASSNKKTNSGPCYPVYLP